MDTTPFEVHIARIKRFLFVIRLEETGYLCSDVRSHRCLDVYLVTCIDIGLDMGRIRLPWQAEAACATAIYSTWPIAVSSLVSYLRPALFRPRSRTRTAPRSPEAQWPILPALGIGGKRGRSILRVRWPSFHVLAHNPTRVSHLITTGRCKRGE